MQQEISWPEGCQNGLEDITHNSSLYQQLMRLPFEGKVREKVHGLQCPGPLEHLQLNCKGGGGR